MKKSKVGLSPDLNPDRPSGSTGKVEPGGTSAYFPIEEHDAEAQSAPEAPSVDGRRTSAGWAKAILGLVALASLGAAAVGASRSPQLREILSSPLTLNELRDKAAAIVHTRAPASLEKAGLVPVALKQSNAGSWNAVLRNFTGPRTVDSDCQPCMTAARTAALEKLPSNLAEEVRNGERQLYEVAMIPNAVSNEPTLVDVYFEGNKLTTVRLAVEVPRAIVVPLRIGQRTSLRLHSNRGGNDPLVVFVGAEQTAMNFGKDGNLEVPLLIPEPVRVTAPSPQAATAMVNAPVNVKYTADGGGPGAAGDIDYSAASPPPAAPVKVCPTTPNLDE